MDKRRNEINHIEFGELFAEGLAAGIENRCPSIEQAFEQALVAADKIYDKAVAGMEALCYSIEQATTAVVDAAINLSIKDDV